MKLVTRIIWGISYLGLVLIFGFIFYRGFQDLAFNVQQLYKNSQYQGTTEGQITALQNRRYYYYGGIVYYPGIAFTVGDKTYTFWSYSSFDPNPSAFPLGGHVVGKYDTKDPNKAEINEALKGLWWGIIKDIMGLLFSIWILYKTFRILIKKIWQK